jgi:hypothetical protein
MSAVLDFLGSVWEVITAALRFSDNLLAILEREAHPTAVIVTVVFLSGMSLLIGQSAILFINQVSPFWFAISLIVNGVLFVLHFVLWAVAIWLIGTWGFGSDQAFGPLARMVSLGSAPFIFGWLILLPYLGTFVERVLTVWSFLIVLHAVQYAWGISFGEALVCVGGGWVLALAVTRVVGLPYAALRDRFRRRVTGDQWISNPQDDLLDIAMESFAVVPAQGDKS